MKETIQFHTGRPTLVIEKFNPNLPLRSLNFLPLVDFVFFTKVSKNFGIFLHKENFVWKIQTPTPQEHYIFEDLKRDGTYEEYWNNIARIEAYLRTQNITFIHSPKV